MRLRAFNVFDRSSSLRSLQTQSVPFVQRGQEVITAEVADLSEIEDLGEVMNPDGPFHRPSSLSASFGFKFISQETWIKVSAAAAVRAQCR